MSIYVKEPIGRKFTGVHMLLVMIVFFGCIIAVNIIMATFAMGSWTGLVVNNSYVASQQFNRDLAAAKIQRDAGFYSELTYSKGMLHFVLMNKNAERVNLLNAHAEIGRPAFEQADRKVTLVRNKENTFTFPITLTSGVWTVKVFGYNEDQAYRRDVRLVVDENGNGRLQ